MSRGTRAWSRGCCAHAAGRQCSSVHSASVDHGTRRTLFDLMPHGPGLHNGRRRLNGDRRHLSYERRRGDLDPTIPAVGSGRAGVRELSKRHVLHCRRRDVVRRADDLLHTDGGAHWVKGGSFEFVGETTALGCASATNCYLIGSGSAFRSTDGGTTWSQLSWHSSIAWEYSSGISCVAPRRASPQASTSRPHHRRRRFPRSFASSDPPSSSCD